MKYVTIEYEGQKPGVLSQDGKSVILLEALGKDYRTLNSFIESHTDEDVENLEELASRNDGIPCEKARLLSPIPRAKHDILCVGVNYVSHLEETKSHFFDGKFETPVKTVYFGKRASWITGPEEPINGHLDIDSSLDYEVELAVIIGKTIDGSVPYENLGSYVFGYSVFNDISARRLQSDHNQWYLGKSLDGFSVMGPWIVSADMIPFNGALDIESRVNGEVRQHSNTQLMRMNVADIIYELSRGITLEPGDIIATGTPSGVGGGFTPPRFMKAFDVIEAEIEGIGILRNTIR